MQAWVAEEPGRLRLATSVPRPTVSEPTDVVVRVRSAAVNFADTLMVQGSYQERPDFPFVPGLEVAGEVADPGSTQRRRGELVVGLARPGTGSWAEFALCDTRHLVTCPPGIDPTQAVAIHVNAQTAWFALHQRARIQSCDVLIVHAAAGGVGTMAVQLALADGVSTVLGSASPNKLSVVERLGAVALNNRDPGWARAVRDQWGTVDVAVDMVGGHVFEPTWRLLSFEGRYVLVGFASGDIPTIRANHALVKNVTVHGLYWTRYTAERPDMVQVAAEQIWAHHRTGSIDPLIHRVGGAGDVASLAEELGAGATTGKCVVSFDRR